MNKKSGLVLRIILGGYLVFLGGSLLVHIIHMRPEDMVLKSVIAVIFVLVGGFYAFRNIKEMYQMIKTESEEETTVSDENDGEE